MKPKLTNCAAVLVTPDVRQTAEYYRNVLGFRVVGHYDKEDAFAALYRDSVEIILVQSRFGEVLSNRERYGAGYDVYLDPERVEDVDLLYAELEEKGAIIAEPPAPTPYGSYEFIVEDIDGRRIGIGRIKEKEVFFGEKPADIKNP